MCPSCPIPWLLQAVYSVCLHCICIKYLHENNNIWCSTHLIKPSDVSKSSSSREKLVLELRCSEATQTFAMILEYRCSCAYLTRELNFAAFYKELFQKMITYWVSHPSKENLESVTGGDYQWRIQDFSFGTKARKKTDPCPLFLLIVTKRQPIFTVSNVVAER